MGKGYCVVYLGSQRDDSPLHVKMVSSGSLEAAIRSARSNIENQAFASLPAGHVPAGFMIENTEGDELFRWYR